jgi:hypothetical protein
MKLHLALLASLFHLSNGFTATLRGQLTEEPCSGEESPDFEQCVMLGVAADPSLADVLTDHFEGDAFMNRGGVRKLQSASPCSGCHPDVDYPRGTFCFTYCNDPGTGRRLSEDGTDAPDLVAVYEDGAYKGNSEAADIAKVIIECLSDASTNDPCLPDTVKMSLTVTL